MSAVLVRSGSHSHQVPQVVWPQMEPVIRVSTVNTTPTSTEAAASASQPTVRFQRYMALAKAVTAKAV